MTVPNVGYGQTASASYATLQGLIQEFSAEKFQITTNVQSNFLASGALEEVDADGEEIVVEVEVGSNPTTSFIGDFGRRPIGQTATPAKGRVVPSNTTAVLSLGQTATLTKMSVKGLSSTFDNKMTTVAEDVARFRCRALFNNSVSPQAAATWSAITANATVTIPFLDVSMFKPNAAYDFCDLSSAKSYVVRCVSVTPAAVGASSANVAGNVAFINDVPDPTTSAAVALTDVNVATGDIFRLRGTTAGFGGAIASITGQALNSFDDIAGSGAALTMIGIDPSVTPGWVGQTISAGAAYSQELVMQFASRVNTYGGHMPTHYLMHSQLAVAHAISSGQSGAANGIAAGNIMGNRTMTLDKTMDKYGSIHADDGEDGSYRPCPYTVAGRPVIIDDNLPPSTLICHNKKKVKLATWKKMSPDEEAGSSLLLSRTFFAKETYFSASEQLYPVKRSCIGTITGITNL